MPTYRFRGLRIVTGLCLLALVVASCAAGPAGPVAPSAAPATASRSAAATEVPGSSSQVASPTPSRDPRPGGLAVGRVAEIVTTDLVVRSLPEISDGSAIDPLTVPIGFLAYIVDGPVTADGYDWYQVAPFPGLTDFVEPSPVFGWLAAAGKDGEPWIAPWEGDCPEPNWDGVMLSQRLLALSCWGGADLTLEGTFQHCNDDSPTGQPAWLFAVPCHLVGPDYGELLAGGLQLSFAPDVRATARDGARVRVTGHLDDPAARTCTEDQILGAPEQKRPELVRLGCRLRFVVTEITER